MNSWLQELKTKVKNTTSSVEQEAVTNSQETDLAEFPSPVKDGISPNVSDVYQRADEIARWFEEQMQMLPPNEVGAAHPSLKDADALEETNGQYIHDSARGSSSDGSGDSVAAEIDVNQGIVESVAGDFADLNPDGTGDSESDELELDSSDFNADEAEKLLQSLEEAFAFEINTIDSDFKR